MSESKQTSDESTSEKKVVDDTGSSGEEYTITVRSTKERHNFTVRASLTVEELKKMLAGPFKITKDQALLTVAGKILKDKDTLGGLGIKSQSTVYLVIRAIVSDPLPPVSTASSASSGPASSASSGPASSASSGPGTARNTPLFNMPTNAFMADIITPLMTEVIASSDFVDVLQQLQNTVQSDPVAYALIRNLLSDPHRAHDIVQGLLRNFHP